VYAARFANGLRDLGNLEIVISPGLLVPQSADSLEEGLGAVASACVPLQPWDRAILMAAATFYDDDLLDHLLRMFAKIDAHIDCWHFIRIYKDQPATRPQNVRFQGTRRTANSGAFATFSQRPDRGHFLTHGLRLICVSQ
jgi:hypothetical protein